MAQKVINEAKFINRRGRVKKPGLGNFEGAPLWGELSQYLSELTESFMLERRAKIGREYKVTGVTKMSEFETRDNISVFVVWFNAMSTTMKMANTVDEMTLKQSKSKSKFYKVKFMVQIDLTNFNKNKTVTNLKKDLQSARSFYWCNCMSFNFQGMAYRSGAWSLRTQNIPDPSWRARHGKNSKVCKHIASISIDLSHFAHELYNKIKKLDT